MILIITKKSITFLTVYFCLGILLVPNNIPISACDIEPFFSISILSPINGYSSNQNPLLFIYELPKIGIGVDVFDFTSWPIIVDRTWDYEGPYPIPPYEDGGFDILSISYVWGLYWEPDIIFDSQYLTPLGWNYYQYSNQEMDWVLNNYTLTQNYDDYLFWSNKAQEILYEDNPAIALIDHQELTAMDNELTGFNGILWINEYQTMENWVIPEETEFHYAIPSTFDNFHIYKYDEDYDCRWLSQIYTGLMKRSDESEDKLQFLPHIASSIESTDGMNYTVTLNPNVRFADGIQLNASDIKYSYDLVLTYPFYANDYLQLSNSLSPQSITIINEFELKFSFNKPYVFQDKFLAIPILPKHIWQNIDYSQQESQALTWASSSPDKLVGTGPYYLENYVTDTTVHLKRNDYYDDWTGITPYFEDIYFDSYANKESAISALANQQIDMIDPDYGLFFDELPASNCKYDLSSNSRVDEFSINNLHPFIGTGESCPISSPESGKHVRKAMSYIFPRERVVNDYLDGLAKPAVTVCPQSSPCYNSTLQFDEYSIELAKAEMELAGFIYPTTSVSNIGLLYVIGILGLLGGSIKTIHNLKKQNLSVK
ncbi:MAG: hypothetical protein FK734_20800 [Asgard group archaeon]|nr:hypothetical protein [Asgard group archaeon]